MCVGGGGTFIATVRAKCDRQERMMYCTNAVMTVEVWLAFLPESISSVNCNRWW